jgi:SAM-dependent methyltransferase
MTQASRSYSLLKITKELGFECGRETKIMDFGCGSGSRVHELRELGYQVFGCDLQFKHESNTDTESMMRNGIVRLIDKERYVLPFDDSTFDIVFSDQVFEHVQDYSQAIAEIARILKPEGMCLHIFPARYTPMEPHVCVPFATMIQSRWWLGFWALVGVRSDEQRSMSARETAARNYDYLSKRTNYLPKKVIRTEFRSHFHFVVFAESIFLKHSQRGRYISRLSKLFPFLPSIYSTFRSRVVFAKHPSKMGRSNSSAAQNPDSRPSSRIIISRSSLPSGNVLAERRPARRLPGMYPNSG